MCAAIPPFPFRRRTLLGAGLGLGAGAVLASSGCSGGGGADGPDLSEVSVGAMEDFRAGTPFRATEDLTFTSLYPEWPDNAFSSDWRVWQEITERTRVSTEHTTVPLSDYPQKRSLLISSGESPTLIPLTYVGEETPFTSSQAVLPVSDYLDLLPNFRARVAEWGLEADLDTMRQTDGRFYLLPGLFEAPNPDFSPVFRLDVLEEQGLEVPRTWEEVRTALEVFRERMDRGYPWSDPFQGNATLNVAATGFGTQAGWGYGNGTRFDPDADGFVFAPLLEPYRQMVEFFHGLVADGLLDPESFTQDTELAERKFMTGQSYVATGSAGNPPVWRRTMDEELGEDAYRIGKIPFPAGPAGAWMGGGRLWHGYLVAAGARQSPHFVAMMQYLDWLLYDVGTKEMLKWGVEGETFTKGADGSRRLVEDIGFEANNPGAPKDLKKDYGFALNHLSDGLTLDLAQSLFAEEEREFQAGMLRTHELIPADPPAPLDPVEQEQATLLVTPLTDDVTSTTLRFILGDRPLGEWDAWCDQLRGNGADQYTELVTTAYRRYRDENG